MAGEGACMQGGVYGRGHVWQGGACVVGGGHVWQERQPLQWAVRILLECILVTLSDCDCDVPKRWLL